MSMPEFNKMMTHEIELIKRKKNQSGDFSNISITPSLPAFVQYGNYLIEDEKGEKVEAIAIIFLKDDCGIDSEYPYWFINQTSPYSRTNMEVLKIDPIDHPLQAGKTHHYELFVR